MTPLLYRSATLADLDAICQLGDQITAIHHSARPQYFAPTGPAERDRPVWQACLYQEIGYQPRSRTLTKGLV